MSDDMQTQATPVVEPVADETVAEPVVEEQPETAAAAEETTAPEAA